MRFIARWLVIVVVAAVADQLSVSAATVGAKAANQKTVTNQQSSQDQQQWRYTFHNGEWWYWLPAGRWVYWRDGRWNDYHPKTYVPPPSPRAVIVGRNPEAEIVGRNPVAETGEETDEEAIRPFYGHVIPELDRRPVEPGSEVGPFYGHPLPTEVFGFPRRRLNRPFYGHPGWDYGE